MSRGVLAGLLAIVLVGLALVLVPRNDDGQRALTPFRPGDGSGAASPTSGSAPGSSPSQGVGSGAPGEASPGGTVGLDAAGTPQAGPGSGDPTSSSTPGLLPGPGVTDTPQAPDVPGATSTPAPGEPEPHAAIGPDVVELAPTYPYAREFTRTRTWFGTALSSSDGTIKQALSRNDQLFSRMPVVRQFDPQIPPDGAWSRRTELHDRVLSTSFREPPAEILSGQHDARILEYFRQAPTRKPIFWTYFHEPEPHVLRGEFTTKEYRAAWRHVVRLAARARKTNLYPTLILTGWTADPRSKRNWRDYYAGDDYISVLAWDPYNSATRQPTAYADPETLYRHVRDRSRAAGKPWAVAETGSMLVRGDDGSARAAWLRRVGRWFEANDAVFVTYFQSTRDGNFKLSDDHSVAAWRDAVRRSAG